MGAIGACCGGRISRCRSWDAAFSAINPQAGLLLRDFPYPDGSGSGHNLYYESVIGLKYYEDVVRIFPCACSRRYPWDV